MREEWRPVLGYEGIYEVSSRGRVRRVSTRSGRPILRLLKPSIASTGYPSVSLSAQGNIKTHAVHVLVADAFNLGSGPQVRHLDGDKQNNRADNLIRGTASENLLDAVRHGTYRNKYVGKTACVRGHEYTPENTKVRIRCGRQSRVCRTCERERIRAFKLAKKEKN